MPAAEPPESLQRAIGPRALACAIVNSVVGSGIFVLPAIMGAGLGGAAILAYLVCGMLMVLIGLCLAEVGSSTTTSGGPYAYIEKAFGPFAGFLANNICWLGGSVVADAAISNALAATLAQSFPALGMGAYRVAFLLLLFGGLAWLNISSVKKGVRFIEFATLGKLVPLIVLVLVASRYVEADNLRSTIEPTLNNVGTASLLLFYAFLGMDTPLSAGGEVKNPRRTVPSPGRWRACIPAISRRTWRSGCTCALAAPWPSRASSSNWPSSPVPRCCSSTSAWCWPR